jgi:hypothetical protein
MKQLRANVSTHLKFFRRNRLLLAIAIVFTLVAAIYTTASLLFQSTAGRFELIRTVFDQLTWYSLIFTAALGLVLMSTHLRGKAVKLVLSKPCSVETWVASGFLSAILVSAILYTVVFLVSVSLSLIWNVPLQSGFAYITIEMFTRAVVTMSVITFLATLFHPIVALMLMMFFNEQMFYGLRLAFMTAVESTGGNVLLPFIEKAMYAIYMLLPMQNLLSELSSDVYMSMRVTGEQWRYLMTSVVYSLCVATVFYLLSVRAVYRKNLM